MDAPSDSDLSDVIANDGIPTLVKVDALVEYVWTNGKLPAGCEYLWTDLAKSPLEAGGDSKLLLQVFVRLNSQALKDLAASAPDRHVDSLLIGLVDACKRAPEHGSVLSSVVESISEEQFSTFVRRHTTLLESRYPKSEPNLGRRLLYLLRSLPAEPGRFVARLSVLRAGSRLLPERHRQLAAWRRAQVALQTLGKVDGSPRLFGGPSKSDIVANANELADAITKAMPTDWYPDDGPESSRISCFQQLLGEIAPNVVPKRVLRQISMRFTRLDRSQAEEPKPIKPEPPQAKHNLRKSSISGLESTAQSVDVVPSRVTDSKPPASTPSSSTLTAKTSTKNKLSTEGSSKADQRTESSLKSPGIARTRSDRQTANQVKDTSRESPGKTLSILTLFTIACVTVGLASVVGLVVAISLSISQDDDVSGNESVASVSPPQPPTDEPMDGGFEGDPDGDDASAIEPPEADWSPDEDGSRDEDDPMPGDDTVEPTEVATAASAAHPPHLTPEPPEATDPENINLQNIDPENIVAESPSNSFPHAAIPDTPISVTSVSEGDYTIHLHGLDTVKYEPETFGPTDITNTFNEEDMEWVVKSSPSRDGRGLDVIAKNRANIIFPLCNFAFSQDNGTLQCRLTKRKNEPLLTLQRLIRFCVVELRPIQGATHRYVALQKTHTEAIRISGMKYEIRSSAVSPDKSEKLYMAAGHLKNSEGELFELSPHESTQEPLTEWDAVTLQEKHELERVSVNIRPDEDRGFFVVKLNVSPGRDEILTSKKKEKTPNNKMIDQIKSDLEIMINSGAKTDVKLAAMDRIGKLIGVDVSGFPPPPSKFRQSLPRRGSSKQAFTKFNYERAKSRKAYAAYNQQVKRHVLIPAKDKIKALENENKQIDGEWNPRLQAIGDLEKKWELITYLYRIVDDDNGKKIRVPVWDTRNE